MESHGKIPWYLVNYPDRGMIEKDSTMAIDLGFLYIGITSPSRCFANPTDKAVFPEAVGPTIVRIRFVNRRDSGRPYLLYS